MNFFKKHPYWTAFLLSLLLGILVVLPSIINGNGVFYFIDDFNQQEIPFNVYLNEAIKSGSTMWDFHNDLGASFIGSYSFYNLASPFVIILWLFPASIVPYLLGPMFALKYAVAGLTAFMFLNRFLKNKKYALLGSLLYAFSGFQFVNMIFYHFHDCVALFPLLLYGLDRLIKDNKKGIFALSVALNLFTNYFFFIGQVVFVLLYYVVMNITKQYHFTWKKFGQIALESILGVGLGAIILIPSALFVISNPRISGNWTLSSMAIPSLGNVLEVLRALLFPNDSMTFHSAINMMNYGSVEAFLPLVGTILWFTYLVKNPKNPLSIFMFVLLLFMIVPIFNSSFFAFTPVYYARWFYMAILFMSLLSMKTLEEKIPITKGVIATFVALALFGVGSMIYVFQGNTFSYQPVLFTIVASLLVICVLFVIFALRRKKAYVWLLVGTCIYIVSYGNYFCFYNRIAHGDQPGTIDRYQNMKTLLANYEDDVRYNHDESCDRNILFFANKMSITSWNSNIEGSAFTFYKNVGIGRDVLTKIEPSNHDLQDFLSVKYIVSCNGVSESISKDYPVISQNGNVVIYENKDYLPLGTVYTSYISTEEFEKLDHEKRKEILKQALVLNEEQITKYQHVLKPDGKKQPNKVISNEFTTTSKGFTAKVTVEQDALLLYTFAYSDGFQATVNGKVVDIENVDHGFMAIPVQKGENDIVFTFYPKGLSFGTAVSVGSLVLFGVYMVLGGRKK